MRLRVLIPVALSASLLFVACASSRPTAHLIINNDSNTDIPMNFVISEKGKKPNSKTISQTIKPGLQELDAEKFVKGAYTISAETNNGQVCIKQNLSLDADRWIIINYVHNDSLNIHKKYGYVDVAALKKIDSKYAGIDMYSSSRRPASLTL
jgi:hypothetical protein